MRRWFVAWGWTYRPASWQGSILTVLALVFCVQVFVAVDRHSHSASDTLYGIFPFVVPCLMLLHWIASHTAADGADGAGGAGGAGGQTPRA